MTPASLAPASHSGRPMSHLRRSMSHLWLSPAFQGDLFRDMSALCGTVAR